MRSLVRKKRRLDVKSKSTKGDAGERRYRIPDRSPKGWEFNSHPFPMPVRDRIAPSPDGNEQVPIQEYPRAQFCTCRNLPKRTHRRHAPPEI